MANKLGGNPSSSGWKPPSEREHPPKAGAHSPGPCNDHGGDEGNRNLPNAVSRPPNGSPRRRGRRISRRRRRCADRARSSPASRPLLQEPLCDEQGCNELAFACYLPDGEHNGNYCSTHAFDNGFCKMCGMFNAGIESFDFGNGYCDMCQVEVDILDGTYDDDDADFDDDDL